LIYDNGIFSLSHDPTNLKLIRIENSEGATHSFDLSNTPHPKEEEWIPIGQQGSAALRRGLRFKQNLAKKQAHPDSNSKNRFSSLAEEDGHPQPEKTIPHQGKADKHPSVPTPPTNRTKPTRGKSKPTDDSLSVESTAAIKNPDISPAQSKNGDTDDEEVRYCEGDADKDMEDASIEAGDREERADSIVPDELQAKGEEEPKAPIVIELTSHTPNWCAEESDGEAACSGDERSSPKKNIIPTLGCLHIIEHCLFLPLSKH
jgi:hypothetical protein